MPRSQSGNSVGSDVALTETWKSCLPETRNPSSIQRARMVGPANEGPYFHDLSEMGGIQTPDRAATNDADSLHSLAFIHFHQLCLLADFLAYHGAEQAVCIVK